ncbi:TRAP transporter small permease [Pseudooceanicola sp. C21-150M6]|uniref:TRAP transporter small permease n=1 Tax=Pseudooceanicola sp. C21-150M6 TaxID=3434355 RepID=UPI003D7F21CC
MMQDPVLSSDTVQDTDVETNDLRATLARLSFEEIIALVLIVLLCVLVFAQFSLRYLASYSILWGEEMSRTLLIMTVFAGSAAAVHRKTHIAADIWEVLGGAPLWLQRGRHLVCTLFYGYSAWLAWETAGRVWPSSMSSVDLSRGWIFIIVMLCLIAATLRSAMHVIAPAEPETK